VPRHASPARRVAFRVVRRVFEQGAFADQALRAEAEGLEPRERAFARQLAFGTIQRRRTLDHVAKALTGSRKLDPPVLAALRLGLFQLLFLDGVPDHAAVAESVELAKETRGAGLVNAVLRRAAREGRAVLDAIEDDGVRHSVPDWLVRLWRDAYGPATTRALLATVNEPPELALRANRLRTTPEELAAAVGGRAVGPEELAAVVGRRVGAPQELAGRAGAPSARAGAVGGRLAAPDAVVVDGPFDAAAHPLFAAGHFTPQSRSSQSVARTLDPQPGERVLDLCAAPGGKSTHLAELMGDEGEVVSVERNPARADAMRRTVARLGTTSVRVEVADAAAPRRDGPFDRVLADPPCSGLGTLQARPDLRWRMDPGRIAALRAEQERIATAARAALRPGGTFVWSTCTLNPAEDLEPADEHVTLFPHATRSAGFQVSSVRS